MSLLDNPSHKRPLPSIDDLDVSVDTYRQQHPEYEAVITGALVFHGRKLLLVQRAEHDSWPGKWETPGGQIDPDDPTILHGVARELREESGLIAVHVKRCVGADSLTSRRGIKFIKLSFEVQIQTDPGQESDWHRITSLPTVTLDPNEHQNYVWVTEDDMNAGRIGDINIDITSPEHRDTIMFAFSQRRIEMEGSGLR